jgi:formate hydrogenlyase transcriptional activator
MSNATIRSEFSRAEHAQLLARVAALEELLSVHEEVVLEQSKHLEGVLCELRDFNAELEARVSARTLELSEANRILRERFERERLMLETNNAVVSQLDLRELLKNISFSLRAILPHDGALLTLHDPESDQLRLQALDLQTLDQVPFEEGVLIAMHDTPEGQAIMSRQPVLVCPTVDLTRFSSPWVRHAVENGVRSGCAVPLIAHDRTLGALSVVSGRENAFDEADAELLNQCAGQIAIAVENALNYQRAKQERDRFEMALEISKAVSASLKLRELLQATSAILRRHIHHDFAGLALYEEDSQQFRYLALDEPPEFLEEGGLIPLEGTPDGLAFKTRQAVWRECVDLAEFHAPSMQQAWQAGMRSGCAVPLISRDRVIGVLGVGSNREASITRADAETLQLMANQIASAVENALNFERALQAEREVKRQLERERLMLEINNAVVAQLDLRELVRVISTSLREVLHPDVTGISLYDPETRLFRAYRFDMPDSFPPIPDGTPMPLEGTVGGMAFESGQPIFMSRPDPAVQTAEFDRRLMEAGIQSGGVVPLIAHDKKLGFLGVGSFREDAFPPADQELLCHIANQIAIAVENSLNFERAQQAEQESRRRFERERLMLEINNAVVANLALPDLLAAISACLRRVVPHDFAGLALYDADIGQLRVQALDYQRNQEIFGTNDLIPLHGTGSGKAFRSRQTLLWSQKKSVESSIAVVQQVIAAGFKSSCHVPLIVQDRALGTLDVISGRENAFSEADVELLTQVGNQIAIAVENALNFERARQAERQAAEERDRSALLLDINNAVIWHLDLKELVQAVSASLREILPHDAAGIALYDAERAELREYANVAYSGVNNFPLGEVFSLAGTAVGQVFTSGQPLLLRRADAERFPADRPLRPDEKILTSACLVPLTSHGRKLGVLGVGNNQADKFTEADLARLAQIAGQVAIAVENALNFERAQQAEQESRRQFERLRLMLDVNNATVTQLDLHELVRVISNCLREALQLAIAGVSLYDAEAGCLRAYYYDLPDTMTPIEAGTPLPLEGSIAGQTFTTGQPVLLNRDEQWDAFPVSQKLFLQTGIKSGGCVPLIVQGRKLGVLGVDSYEKDAFPPEREQLLCQIADQLALAVDNALNFERARKAEQEVTRQLEREHLMLEINNAVVSNLSLPELLAAISASMRRVVPHDFAGLALYDADLGQLRVQALDYARNQQIFGTTDLIPLKGTGAGKAFTSRKTTLLRRFRSDATESAIAIVQRMAAAGFKSSCHVPLISRDRALGTLDVMSIREDAFSEEDAELLTSIGQQIAIAVDNALAYREIETLKNKVTEEKLYLEEEIKSAWSFEEIIGSSPALRRILKQVETVAPTDSTVLIQGETGTGKELIARAIHSLSSRRERTLVKLNCAAIPTGLLESELFGHEKGSFTGAIAQRIGRFELAHKGTMFLDEVGEIPLELQPKLLRVLQEQEFERLGSARTQRVEVRLIAATNRDLGQMSAENRFRSDLFYRLNVFPITIPPLRERPEDVPLLVRFFANKFALRMKKQIETISAETVAALQRYHWPGNIRELENLIERAVILTQGAELKIPLTEINIPAKKVVPVTNSAQASAASESDALEDIEREHILRVLNETRWVVGGPNGAAARLEMKRTTLQARMKKLGISRQP